MKTLLAWTCLAIALSCDAPPSVQHFALTDTSGREHTGVAWKGKKAVVLFFLGTDCPVSNFYCQEYKRLRKAFADKGVLFYGIHPDPYVTAKDAAKHAAEFHLSFPVLLDPAQQVTRQTGIHVVPSAVLLSVDGRIVYRGRIDDRYNSEGVRREIPTTRDLEEALLALLSGKSPAVAETKAFGCPLPKPRKETP